jgi:hypothetical protein
MQVLAGNLKISTPWLSSAKNDLLFFFAPFAVALLLSTLFRQGAVANSPILLLLLLQGFGLAPFHQGVTWFHYLDRKNRAHYVSEKNIYWSIVLPIAIVLVGTLLFFFAANLFFLVYVIWTIQHIAKQNVGILLLYHNHDLNEIVIDRRLEVGSLQTAAALFSFLFLNGIIKQDGFVALAVHLVILFTAAELAYSLLRCAKSFSTQVNAGKSINAPALAFWALSLIAFLPFALANDYNQGLFIALVMHWFQYIGLNGILVSRKYSDESNKRNLPWPRAILLFAAVGLLFVLLSLPVGLIEAMGVDIHSWQLRIAAGIVNGFVLVHYFQDAFIWRFREPFNRESLLAHLKPSRQLSSLTLVGEPELELELAVR